MHWNFLHKNYLDSCLRRMEGNSILCGDAQVQIERWRLERLVESGCVEKIEMLAGDLVFVMSPCALRVNDELDVLTEAGFVLTDCIHSDVKALATDCPSRYTIREVSGTQLDMAKLSLHVLGEQDCAEKYYSFLDQVYEKCKQSLSFSEIGSPKTALHYLRARALIELDGKVSEARKILLQNTPDNIERPKVFDSYVQSDIEEALFYNGFAWGTLFGDNEKARFSLEGGLDQESVSKFLPPKDLYAELFILILSDSASAKTILNDRLRDGWCGDFEIAQSWFKLFGDSDRCREMAVNIENEAKLGLGDDVINVSNDSWQFAPFWMLMEAEKICFYILRDHYRADLLLLSALWIAVRRKELETFYSCCFCSSLDYRSKNNYKISYKAKNAAKALGSTFFEFDLDLLRVFFEELGIEFQVSNDKVKHFCESL